MLIDQPAKGFRLHGGATVVEHFVGGAQKDQSGNTCDAVTAGQFLTAGIVNIDLFEGDICILSFGCVKHGRKFLTGRSPVGVKLVDFSHLGAGL